MTEPTEASSERSAEPCPRCGAYRLSLIEYPGIRTQPYLPFSELIGITEPRAPSRPAVACLACDAEWPSVEALRAEQPT